MSVICRYCMSVLTLSLVVAGSVEGLAAEKNYDLRPIWKVGQVSRYKAVSTKLSTVDIAALKRKIDQKVVVTTEMSWKILESNPEGGGQAEMTVTHIQMSATGPDGKTIDIGPDTGEAKYEKVVKRLNALIGSPLKVQVGADGKIGTVEGFDAIKQKAGVEDDKSMSEKTFQELASDLAVLAGGVKERKASDTWKVQQKWDHRMGEITFDGDYTLAGVEVIEGVAVAMINRESKLSFEAKLPERPEGAPEVTLEMTDGSQNSQLMFDISRKEFVGLNINQKLAFKSTMTLGPRSIEQLVTEKNNTQIIRIGEE